MNYRKSRRCKNIGWDLAQQHTLKAQYKIPDRASSKVVHYVLGVSDTIYRLEVAFLPLYKRETYEI